MIPKKRNVGRPRENPLPRREQLRAAKRRQRQRERESGLETVQLKLRAPYAALLRRLGRDAQFLDALEALLQRASGKGSGALAPIGAIKLATYPQLRLLAWSRDPALGTVTPQEALALYERNWRFVDVDALDERERALIRRLADEYGAGVLHVRGRLP